MSATIKITSTTTKATRDRGLLDRWAAAKLGDGTSAKLYDEEAIFNNYSRRSVGSYLGKLNRTIKNQLVLASRGKGKGGVAAILADAKRGSALETIGTNNGCKYFFSNDVETASIG